MIDTQNKQIAEHLVSCYGITSYQAFVLYGITRLSARIYDLRKKRILIRAERVENITTAGKRTWFNRYYIRRDDEESMKRARRFVKG